MCTWNRYVEASNEDGEHASVILITSTSFYVQLDDTTNDDDDDDDDEVFLIHLVMNLLFLLLNYFVRFK